MSRNDTFELLREVTPGVLVAVRPGDSEGKQYLASRFQPGPNSSRTTGGRFRDKDQQELCHYVMNDCKQGWAVRNVLNHENLVSIAGYFRNQPLLGGLQGYAPTGPFEDYVAWEFCDAADLQQLFWNTPYKRNEYSYLPESLCWHVLKSLIRAVTWLHDGKRICFEEETQSRVWVSADKDWNPILHRAIIPENIFFQHPRGSETYGLCKLGNFSKAAVTNHVLGELGSDGQLLDEVPPARMREHGFAIAGQTGWEPLHITDEKFRDAMKVDQDGFVSMLSSELFSIGSVLFNMMTGQPLIMKCIQCDRSHILTCGATGCARQTADQAGCSCLMGGCEHIPPQPCQHRLPRHMPADEDLQCTRKNPDINIDEYLARAQYSRVLRVQVRRLLGYLVDDAPMFPMRAEPVARRTEKAFREWREETEEGREYEDTEDWMGDKWGLEESEKGATDELDDVVVIV